MQIVVNGLKWKILNVPRDSEKLLVDGNECFGVTCYVDLVVYMMGDQAKELYRQTLIHELCHVYTFSYACHLTADERTEESVCDFFGAYADKIITHANLIMEKLFGKG